MQKKQKSARNLIAKELFVNAKFKHKKERSYKERIQIQNEEELDNEIKEFIKNDGTYLE